MGLLRFIRIVKSSAVYLSAFEQSTGGFLIMLKLCFPDKDSVNDEINEDECNAIA